MSLPFITKELIASWQENAENNPAGLYKDMVEVIEIQLPPSALQNNLLKNVKQIYEYRMSKNVKFHAAAIESLVNARILLAFIEECSVNFTPPKHKFFSNITEDMLKGAHILIADEGKLFEHILSLKNLYPRFSSHYKQEKIAKIMQDNPTMTPAKAEAMFNKDKPDYSLHAEVIFNESLLGKVTKDDGVTYTWFQFEGHGHVPRSMYKNTILKAIDWVLQLFNYSIEKFLHHLDYVKYTWYKQNVGQFGMSEYTEANPITLQPKVC